MKNPKHAITTTGDEESVVRRKVGRPPVSDEDRLIAKNIRMPAHLWTKIEAAGGAEWLRQLVARAKVK